MSRADRTTHLKVLYVEDEKDLAELLSEALIIALEPLRVRICHVARADEAIAAFRTFHPDVILSDIGLPDSDGFSLMRKLRAESRGRPGPRAIALTAWDRTSDRELAALAGFDAHLCKPVDVDTLVRTIRRLLPESVTAAP